MRERWKEVGDEFMGREERARDCKTKAKSSRKAKREKKTATAETEIQHQFVTPTPTLYQIPMQPRLKISPITAPKAPPHCSLANIPSALRAQAVHTAQQLYVLEIDILASRI